MTIRLPLRTSQLNVYPAAIAEQMRRFYRSLNERDRRRYAAVEAVRLGHGGQEYISQLLGCDPKTIRRGLAELAASGELDTGRQRKKGAGANRWVLHSPT